MKSLHLLLLVAAFFRRGSACNETLDPPANVILRQERVDQLHPKDVSYTNIKKEGWFTEKNYILLPRIASSIWDMDAKVQVDDECAPYLMATLQQQYVFEAGDVVLNTHIITTLRKVRLKSNQQDNLNIGPIMCLLTVKAKMLSDGSTVLHSYPTVLTSGDVLVTTDADGTISTSHLVPTLPLHSATQFLHTSTSDNRFHLKHYNLFKQQQPSTTHLVMDLGVIAQSERHTFEMNMLNLNPHSVHVAYPELAQPTQKYSNPLHSLNYTVTVTTINTTAAETGDHYLVTAATAKAFEVAAIMAKSNLTCDNVTMVLHVPRSFHLPLLAATEDMVHLRDTTNMNRASIVFIEMRNKDSRSFNVVDGVAVVGYQVATILPDHALSVKGTVQQLQKLSATYKVAKNTVAYKQYYYNDYCFYTPYDLINVGVVHSTVATGPATHNGRPINSTSTTGNTTTTSTGTSNTSIIQPPDTWTKPITYYTNVNPADANVMLGSVYPDMINTTIAAIVMTAFDTDSIIMRDVTIRSEHSEIVAEVVMTDACAKKNRVYWLSKGTLSKKTVACATVAFTHLVWM
jgi:hypothetical protein